MKEWRVKALLTLVVACGACVRTGYTGGGADGGEEDATTPRLDGAAVDVATRKDGGKRDGGTPRDGSARRDGGGPQPDARDSGEPDSGKPDSGETDATVDTGNRRDSMTDTGEQEDAPGPKDSGVDVGILACAASTCPVGEACDPSTGKCSTSCAPTQPCTGGCCGATGTCVLGGQVCEVVQTNGMKAAECEPAGQCPACVTSSVCDSALTGSYACTPTGALGTMTACAFGCDPMNGACKDFVPANGARNHLAPMDSFTCLGSPVNTTVPVINTGAGDMLTISTTLTGTPAAGTITWVKNGVPGSTNIPAIWGPVFKPVTGGTPSVVAHISSFSITGTGVTIMGPNALVLLVDGSVSLGGAANSSSLINLSATPTTGGPGFSGANLVGTGGTSMSAAGSGGAGGGVGGSAGGDLTGAVTLAGAVAGMPYETPFLLAAGSPGGATIGDNAGKGGGALQISACGDISIGSFVTIDASGSGGEGGTLTELSGNGGGSGGSIIIEGATCSSLAGTFVANGGGGGQGGSLAATGSGGAGHEWSTTSAISAGAAGGDGIMGALGGGGAGGTGGASSKPAGTPGTSAGVGVGAGGGGGAVGAISIGVSPLVTAMPAAPATSPLPSVSNTCTTVNGAYPTTCSYGPFM